MRPPTIEFAVYREFPDENGLWNPIGEGPYSGGFQVSLTASQEEYRQLAAYFQKLSELDTAGDDQYHEHHGPLISTDGKTRVHLICRINSSPE